MFLAKKKCLQIKQIYVFYTMTSFTAQHMVYGQADYSSSKLPTCGYESKSIGLVQV